MRTTGYLLSIAVAVIALCAPALADEDDDAARVGRMLLSPDETTRHEAEQRLLERIEKGGDVGVYVRAMSTALNEWANREERLVEVWIDQAVNGTADERERAVRLITALGERAVGRLVMELRHARRHDGAPSSTAANASAPAPAPGLAGTPQSAAAVEPDPAPPLRPAPYDVKVLLDDGMNRVQIMNLLRKQANASEVTRAGRLYVVTATDEGHARLKSHIERIKVRAPANDEPAKPERDANEPEADAEESKDAGGKDGKKEGEKTVGGQLAVAGPAWQFTSVVVRVPRREGLGIYDMRRVGTDFAKFGPLFAPKEQVRGTLVKTGSQNDAEVWERFLRTLPDAEAVVAPTARVVENATGESFLGKTLAYRRDVQPAKGGAWMVEQGELRTGLTLSFFATPVRRGLTIEMTAKNADVARPIATTTVRPDKGAEPVVLDQPEWSVATTNATFTLEPEGGGALVVLDGLDDAEDEIVLVVLRVTRAAAQAMQRINANDAASEASSRDG